MKKILLILLLVVGSMSVSAQKGDLNVSALGGYLSTYSGFLYGLNASYHLSDPWEASFSALINPNMTSREFGGKRETDYKSFSADIRLYMIRLAAISTGPALGVQYNHLKHMSVSDGFGFNENLWGVNIGWHLRADVSENIKVNLGWRYTSATDDSSFNLFYVGLGYTFQIP